MKTFHIIAAASILLASSGCKESKSKPGSDVSPQINPAPIVQEAAPAPAREAYAAAELSVEPNPIDVCSSQRKTAVVKVRWDMSKAGVRNYHLWVESPRQPRKLWVSGFKPVGEKVSGNWVKAGTRFTATSAAGVELATVEVRSMPCK